MGPATASDRRLLTDRWFGSVVGATVTMGPVALGFAVAGLIGWTWDWAVVVLLACGWVALILGMHGWAWKYFVWRRDSRGKHEGH